MAKLNNIIEIKIDSDVFEENIKNLLLDFWIYGQITTKEINLTAEKIVQKYIESKKK